MSPHIASLKVNAQPINHGAPSCTASFTDKAGDILKVIVPLTKIVFLFIVVNFLEVANFGTNFA